MKRSENSGYTLIELVLITAVIGIIASMAIPSYINIKKSAEKIACFENERNIFLASFKFCSENGYFPKTENEFVSCGLIDKWPTCPGGGKYLYDLGNGIVVCSLSEHKFKV